MQKTEYARFAALMLGIAEVYDRKLTDATLSIYWETLHGLEYDEINSACRRHVEDHDTGRFMPKPADILRIARPRRPPCLAWSEVERAIMRHGVYETVQFRDGVTNAVVKDMGGWVWLCEQNIDDPWTQREFERRYELYRDERIEIHDRLFGSHEIHNRARGYLDYCDKTIMIGDDDHKRLSVGDNAGQK